ncbi:hypothetical protein LJC10_00545 [Selenomonadales bacterium OttesenSCG-928-I06]|nr:hypothetical protein [Selenomonadales bacterium OttesenSCG-928-I06]
MLRDILFDDVDEVLMVFEDFADKHTFSDLEREKKVTCLAIKEGNISRDLYIRLNAKYDGLFGETITVHVRTKDMFDVPVEDQRIRFDDAVYTVASSENDKGLLTLILTQLTAL